MTLRPSLLPPDTTRARQFAATTRPRGANLAADTNRAGSPTLQSTTFAPNPNRGERRWGTVSVDFEMAQRAIEARREMEARASLQRPRKHLAAVIEGSIATDADSHGRDTAVAARAAHPAGGTRRQKPVASRRSGVPAARRSATTSVAPAAHFTAPARESVAPRRFRSDVATAQVRTASERAASPSPTRGQLTTSLPADVGTVAGATALAPMPQVRPDARRQPTKLPPARAPRADLHVARPPRIPSTPRQRRLRFGFLLTGAFVLLLGVFSSAIALHATLAKNQLVLDDVRVKVTEAERHNQRLRVEVAELEAPAHVIGMASELGLVPADRVSFVSATVPASAVVNPNVQS